MSDNNSGLRTFFTVITSPIWAPVAAVAGADSDNAAKAIGSYPGNLVGNAITNPLSAIGNVGKMMSGNDDKVRSKLIHMLFIFLLQVRKIIIKRLRLTRRMN